jgi:hypothetical protein
MRFFSDEELSFSFPSMEFLSTVVLQSPAPIMVVGRAFLARPTANFHTLFSLYPMSLSEFCGPEVVRNSIIGKEIVENC